MARHTLTERFLHGLGQARRIKLARRDGSHETAVGQQPRTLRLIRHGLVGNDDRRDAGLEQIGAGAVPGLAPPGRSDRTYRGRGRSWQPEPCTRKVSCLLDFTRSGLPRTRPRPSWDADAGLNLVWTILMPESPEILVGELREAPPPAGSRRELVEDDLSVR